MYTKTTGIVLRETSFREADKLLTVLTADLGKCAVLARGARRKGSRIQSAAQLLVYSEMTLFSYKDRYTLNEAETLELFPHIRSDIELLALASYFAEMTEQATDEDRQTPELLSLLLNTLYALDRLNKPPRLVKPVFELRLMCLSGYAPLLEGCAVCGAEDPQSPRLLLAEGTLHCACCRNRLGAGGSYPLTAGALAAMRHVTAGDPKRIFSFTVDEESAKSLGGACERYALTQLDRNFRTLDFYKELLTQQGEPS